MDLTEAIATELGSPVASMTRVQGGDISHAARVALADGRSLFVKHHPDPPPGMFRAEADGLARLATSGTVRIPAVLAVRESDPQFIALEWLESPLSPSPNFDEHLGRSLANLHRAAADGFGGPRSFLATIPQDNTACDSWPEFYAERRLRPILRRLESRGLMPDSLRRRIERVADRLPDLAGPAEAPAMVHGDLWRGNVIADATGVPALIDPATYAGHREMDLAMMRLFGGFPSRVFAAYSEVAPLAPGHEERVGLWQLWPLLTHVELFGRGWLTQLDTVVAAYAR